MPLPHLFPLPKFCHIGQNLGPLKGHQMTILMEKGVRGMLNWKNNKHP
jgi:hypothetical protein